MQADSKRLKRLAAAQAELTRLLGLRAQLEGSSLLRLRKEQSDAILAADRLGAGCIGSSSTVMRRLASLNSAVQLSERRLSELGRDMIKAKVRQNSLRGRAEDAAYGEIRKRIEEQTQDAALGSGANALHKRGVLR